MGHDVSCVNWHSSPSISSTTACPTDDAWRAELRVHCQGFLAALCSTHSYGAVSGAVSRAIQPTVTGCQSLQLCLNEEYSENPHWRCRTIQAAIGKSGCRQPDWTGHRDPCSSLSSLPCFYNCVPSYANRDSFQVQSSFQRSPYHHHLRGSGTSWQWTPQGQGQSWMNSQTAMEDLQTASKLVVWDLWARFADALRHLKMKVGMPWDLQNCLTRHWLAATGFKN